MPAGTRSAPPAFARCNKHVERTVESINLSSMRVSNRIVPLLNTPSPPTKSVPIKSPTFRETPYTIIRTWEFPPLRIKSLLESNPSNPKLLVGGLGVWYGVWYAHWGTRIDDKTRARRVHRGPLGQILGVHLLHRGLDNLPHGLGQNISLTLSLSLYIYIHIYIYTHFVFSLSIYIYICIHVSLSLYIYIYIYVCMSVCIYIYIYIYIGIELQAVANAGRTPLCKQPGIRAYARARRNAARRRAGGVQNSNNNDNNNDNNNNTMIIIWW